MDEKAFRKRHRYVTIVTDLDRGRVLYVAKDRKQESLDGFWGTLRRSSATALKPWRWTCATRMWLGAGTFGAGEKKIVFDKFHVAKHLGEAVDRVRGAQKKALGAEGDKPARRHEVPVVAESGQPLGTKQWRDFKALRDSELKTARAWG